MSWYAGYTKCNHERVVNKILHEKGINTFLPEIIVPSRRNDRKILIKRPLFRNYLFIELDEQREHWMKVFRTPGLARICGNGRPSPIPDEDVEFLDQYARAQGYSSRSAVVHRAVRLLRASELGSDYAQAWIEWSETGDADAWDNTVGDGLAIG